MTVACLVSGCGSASTRRAAQKPRERVHFRASDGVLLDGRLFGSGRLAVVLAHMGRAGDSQADWEGLARKLARRGYLVLTYNRRGVCPRGGAGCSTGVDEYAESWRDIVGAVAFVRSRHARRIVVAGASIGAMAALYAAAHAQVEPDGLIEFAGINHASGYDFTQREVRRIRGRKLFLSARADIYGGADSAREWYGWAAGPKRLLLVPGSDHGTDLLQSRNPQRRRIESAITAFVAQAER